MLLWDITVPFTWSKCMCSISSVLVPRVCLCGLLYIYFYCIGETIILKNKSIWIFVIIKLQNVQMKFSPFLASDLYNEKCCSFKFTRFVWGKAQNDFLSATAMFPFKCGLNLNPNETHVCSWSEKWRHLLFSITVTDVHEPLRKDLCNLKAC